MNLNDFCKKPKEEIKLEFDENGNRIESAKTIKIWEKI